MTKRWPDTKPLYDDKYAKACSQSGCVLIGVHIPPILPGKNGGCGTPTHVVGTNNGTLPCGSLLKQLGEAEPAPYFCGACEADHDGSSGPT